MKIAIGSTNPVKVQATKAVLQPQFADAVFVSIIVPSGVSAQPFGDQETRQGAVNRAQAARLATDAELGVGLEGGVQESELGMFTCAWCAIASNDGRIGVGGNACTLLPPDVADMVRSGVELGHAMDRFTSRHNTKHGLGAIGLLTDGLLTRQSAYEYLIKMALAPFIRQSWY